MSSSSTEYAAPPALASAVLAFILREWSTLYDLGVRIYDRFTRDRIDAPYEVLIHDSTIELCDVEGKKAIFRRKTKVRFLQDYTIALQDFVWGDGNALVDYKISPGLVVDKYKDGERWNLLISLRQTKARGEIEEFNVERMAQNGFRSAEEWVQADTWLPTQFLRLRILFPKKRPCKKAWVIERSRQRTKTLPLESKRILPDGRTELVWEQNRPRRGEVFTLKWLW